MKKTKLCNSSNQEYVFLLLCKNDIKIPETKFKQSQIFILSYLNRNNNPTHGTNTVIPLLHRTKGTPQILKI